MQEKIKIPFPVIVEGRYDKQLVSSAAEGNIITLDGFSVFNNAEKICLLRRLCENGKIILLTDSDSAGAFIRAKLKGYLPADKIINLYTPRVCGKEKRKKTPSKEGVLGVEGMDTEVIRRILLPFAGETKEKAGITKTRLYTDGLLGGENSAARRDKFSSLTGIPRGMTPKAFLEAVNMICTHEEYVEAVKKT